ncbi:hypothetical protein ACLKA6_010310 [Drosophila palustris]
MARKLCTPASTNPCAWLKVCCLDLGSVLGSGLVSTPLNCTWSLTQLLQLPSLSLLSFPPSLDVMVMQ